MNGGCCREGGCHEGGAIKEFPFPTSWSTSGRYASYWKAFLLCFMFPGNVEFHTDDKAFDTK